jgi:methylated-DNA-[protein]-cysteine S-methyltransferase
MSYFYSVVPSPVGLLTLVASGKGLAGILWEHEKAGRVPHLQNGLEQRSHSVLTETERQLAEYFAGQRKGFDIPLDFVGAGFNKKVWAALLNIPYGETRTYGQIALELGVPGAARAVGAANGRNPISIIAPCHRVIGASGKLTGFAGGLAAKAYLLQLEAAHAARRLI